MRRARAAARHRSTTITPSRLFFELPSSRREPTLPPIFCSGCDGDHMSRLRIPRTHEKYTLKPYKPGPSRLTTELPPKTAGPRDASETPWDRSSRSYFNSRTLNADNRRSVKPGLVRRCGSSPGRLPWPMVLLAGTLTIFLLSLLGDATGAPVLIAVFGSSSFLGVLLPESVLSRPVNIVGGHAVSAACGILLQILVPSSWWALGLAVGAAMVAMAALRVIFHWLAVRPSRSSWLMTDGATSLRQCSPAHSPSQRVPSCTVRFSRRSRQGGYTEVLVCSGRARVRSGSPSTHRSGASPLT
ncbi:HPP family protein [Paenarthrobacter sp. NPDC090522]|uniref:HPP family protein n=1 Tax=Paenarthrobacter sp. NPDC090522 TaxID=3364383 RepID=UPI0037FE8BC7